MWPLLVRFVPRLVVHLTHVIPSRPLPVLPYREDAAGLRRRGLRSLDTLIAASPYRGSDTVRQAILAFKYRYHPLLHRQLAALLCAAVRASDLHPDDAVLCPVPCTWMRRHTRGFNQAELLAWSVARTLGLRSRKLLRCRRATESQTGRSRTERFAAQESAFSLRPRAVIPARVILIDDVSTSGATLDACAEVLKQAGANRVEAWVVAHDAWKSHS